MSSQNIQGKQGIRKKKSRNYTLYKTNDNIDNISNKSNDSKKQNKSAKSSSQLPSWFTYSNLVRLLILIFSILISLKDSKEETKFDDTTINNNNNNNHNGDDNGNNNMNSINSINEIDISQEKYFELIRNDNLHTSIVPRRNPWLESRFHFRFAQWHPDSNKFSKKHGFGRLHVLNDDIVKPNNGFGEHTHANQEIFSYVLNGQLSHKHTDKNGKSHSEALGRGSVQYMSAGSWVEHSELNENSEKSCRFLQTWIYPNKKDLPVQYGSKIIDFEDRHNKLYQMICGINSKGNATIQLMQDVNVYVSEMDENKSIKFELSENRQAYLVCAEGKLNVNNHFILDTREAARLYGKVNLILKAVGKNGEIDKRINEAMPSAHIMIIELNKEDEWDNATEPDANGKDGGGFSLF